ncbi:MAG: type II CAAX endopeptidase family protein [Halobacteriales archaeon]|nr:type II CAAX endopeptidase family protein [Halobacteriales archaeon]
MSLDTSGVGSPAERIRALGTGLFLAIVAFLVGIVASVFALGLLQSAGITLGEGDWGYYALQTVGLQGVGFGLTSLLFLKLQDRFDIIEIRVPTRNDVKLAILGVFGLLAVVLVLSALYTQFDVQLPETTLPGVIERQPDIALYLIPFTILFVAPGEELLARGVIQGRLKDVYPPGAAIVLASVVFTLGHAGNLVATPLTRALPYFAQLFVLSLVLGWLYERSENLLVVVFVHAVYNSITFLSQYAAATAP